MGIHERRVVEIAKMKQKIIDAAVELIEEEGYEKLSIRKIATKIEYSPTTIYLYYRDKAEIITDMSGELYRKVELTATAIINGNSALPIGTQVHSILRSFIQSLCSEPEMARAIMYSGTNVIFANENRNGTPTNAGIALLDALFAKGIAQKALRPNAANTSWMMISALFGFVMNSIENKLYLLDNFNELADDFVEILMGGIRR